MRVVGDSFTCPLFGHGLLGSIAKEAKMGSISCIIPRICVHACVFRARKLYKKFNKIIQESSNRADKTCEDSVIPHSNCPAAEEDRPKDMWTLCHGFFAVMGGFELKAKDELIKRDKDGMVMNRILPAGLIYLEEMDIFPPVPKASIEAKSKSDGLGKALVCIQVLWMMIQTIARKIEGLPITLLELNTLAHIGCAIILYLTWWSKPQDVTDPIIIDLSRCERCNEILRQRDFMSKCVCSGMINSENLGLGETTLSRYETLFFLSGLSAIYGGIHLIAWNAHFPSTVEQIMWRFSACIVASSAFLFWGWPLVVTFMWPEHEEPFWFLPLFVISLLVYTSARLFLVLEAFISIRSLPVGAYDTVNWVNFFPHIG